MKKLLMIALLLSIAGINSCSEKTYTPCSTDAPIEDEKENK